MCKSVRAKGRLSSYMYHSVIIHRSRASRYSGSDGATMLCSARFIISLIIEPQRKSFSPFESLSLSLFSQWNKIIIPRAEADLDNLCSTTYSHRNVARRWIEDEHAGLRRFACTALLVGLGLV